MLCALMPAGCFSNSYGVSYELHGGATRVDVEDDAGMSAGTVTALWVGLGLAFEYDAARDANLGLGLTGRVVHVPAAGAEPATTAPLFPMHVWYGAAVGGRANSSVRPRVNLGWFQAASNGGAMVEGYANVGVSIHPAVGRAVHVMAGPDFIANDGGHVGAILRLRYFRMSRRKCDDSMFGAGGESC